LKKKLKYTVVREKMSSGNSGMGTLNVLQIIFIVLKLLKVINWSWWLIFIPTYISVGMFILVMLIAYLFS
jgi:hypothetical protein